MPIIVVIITPRRIAPGTFIIKRTTVTISPITATNAEACDIFMFTKPIVVPVSVVQIPAFTRPIIVINNQIPTETAFFIVSGIDFIIASRTPHNESKINIIPSTKTAVNANCQEQPIPNTTE